MAERKRVRTRDTDCLIVDGLATSPAAQTPGRLTSQRLNVFDVRTILVAVAFHDAEILVP